DEPLRLREAQVEHRSERLAAGDHAPHAFGVREALHRGSDVGCALVIEGRRLHACSRAACRAASSRRGVTGVSVISTPSGASASLTAFTIAAGGAMAPPSPMPFWPNSV